MSFRPLVFVLLCAVSPLAACPSAALTCADGAQTLLDCGMLDETDLNDWEEECDATVESALLTCLGEHDCETITECEQYFE